MDIVSDFRTLALSFAGLVALVAAGYFVMRRLRPPAPPPPPAEWAPEPAEPGYLDSSHIISSPLLRPAPPGTPDDPAAGAATDDGARRP
jgi:hypothetical protein